MTTPNFQQLLNALKSATTITQEKQLLQNARAQATSLPAQIELHLVVTLASHFRQTRAAARAELTDLYLTPASASLSFSAAFLARLQTQLQQHIWEDPVWYEEVVLLLSIPHPPEALRIAFCQFSHQVLSASPTELAKLPAIPVPYDRNRRKKNPALPLLLAHQLQAWGAPGVVFLSAPEYLQDTFPFLLGYFLKTPLSEGELPQGSLAASAHEVLLQAIQAQQLTDALYALQESLRALLSLERTNQVQQKITWLCETILALGEIPPLNEVFRVDALPLYGPPEWQFFQKVYLHTMELAYLMPYFAGERPVPTENLALFGEFLAYVFDIDIIDNGAWTAYTSLIEASSLSALEKTSCINNVAEILGASKTKIQIVVFE